eukprot:TRINITY_DN18046_c0_g1_i1.p1 TRINITY_DN18046_c0_g1~~TRINITY_DN18046_c0_g1_i1.p1  ORF type:complete len:1000 (+),score=160.41 TRINITY_DN18046_c0_g1_i1:347-3346(+)
MARASSASQSQSQSKARGAKSRQSQTQKQRLQRGCALLCLGILVVWLFVWLLSPFSSPQATTASAVGSASSKWTTGGGWFGRQWSSGPGSSLTTSTALFSDERFVPGEADIVHYLEIKTVASKPLKIENLDVTIESSQFIKAVLDPIYKKIVRGHHMSAPCDGGNPECPAFGICLNKGACFTTALCEVRGLIEAYHFLVPPKNWGAKRYANADNQVMPFEGNVFVVENVFINAWGQVFNATHEFYFGGCQPKHSEPPTYDERYEVTHYAFATTLLSWRGGSYYHAVMEGLAQLLLLEPILHKHPELPVLLEVGQKQDASLFAEAGWPLNSLNSVWMDKSVPRLAFVQKAILPARFYCEQPTKAVLQRIKMQMLKTPPPRQLPSDFDPKDTLWELVGTDDWSIGLSFRPESKSSRIHLSLIKELETRYGSDRVEVVYGVQPIADVRRIFKETILLIGEHQEGLTNMLFMPPGAVIVEILPKSTSTKLPMVYRYMADRLLLQYYIVSGVDETKANAPIRFDVAEVVELAGVILPPELMPSRVRQTVLEEDPELRKKAAALMAAVKEKGGEESDGGEEESELTDVIPFSSLLSLPRAHRTLAHAINMADLTSVALQTMYRTDTTTKVAAECDVLKGGVSRCPVVAPCANLGEAVAVGQCKVEGIADKAKLGSRVINAPDENSETESMRSYEGKVFVLEDVYLNAYGVAFNSTHVFGAGGCVHGYPTQSYTAQAKVTEFGVLASAISVHGGAFSSWILETLPNFYLLDSFLQQHPNLPLALESWQKKEASLFRSIEQPLDKLRIEILSRSRDELLFVKKLLLPARPLCARPSTSLLLGLRTRYFGVTYPAEKPKGHLWQRARATEWNIAVLCRPESNIQESLVTTLAHTYGESHIIDLHQLAEEPEATVVAKWRSILAKTVVLVGETQEGLTNMLYMAPGTAVLEIRPSGYTNRGYHYVADRLSIDYYLLVVEGEKEGPLKTDVGLAVKQVRSILPAGKVGGA